MPNVCWRMHAGYQISVMNKNTPSREEWDDMVQKLTPLIGELRGTIVYTEGGSPSAMQRRHLRNLFNQKSPPAAIITESIVAHTAITALNLFFSGSFRAFSPRSLREALLYVNAPSSSWDSIYKTFLELAQELGISLHEEFKLP
jgi:hypothetical protein